MDNEASSQKKRSDSNKLQLPVQPRKRHPSISRSDIKDKDGFIIEQKERDFLVQQFLNNQSINMLNKGAAYQVPEGHFLYGKTIPFDLMKDDHNNIFAVHDGAKLGKGAFGAVVTGQAIYAEEGSSVKIGEFFAVKRQKPEDQEALDNIKKEMVVTEKFGLVVGGLQVGKEDKITYFSVMPLLEGKEMAKNTPSYQGYEEKVKPIDASDDKEIKMEGKEIQTLFSSEGLDGLIKEKPKIVEPVVLIVPTDTQSYDSLKPFSSVQTPSNPSGSLQQFSSVQTPSNPSGSLQQFSSVQTPSNPSGSVQQINSAEAAKPSEPPEPPPKPLLVGQNPVSTPAEKVGKIEDFDINHWLTRFQKMADEIEKSHAKGILHLDIKPENFMYDPSNGQVKLIDFGLSRFINEIGDQKPKELFGGTLAYMGPEFLSDSFQEKMSTKQDIYALAKSYELLFCRQMQDLITPPIEIKVYSGDDFVFKQGTIYLEQDKSGNLKCIIKNVEGKEITETLPFDSKFQYDTGRWIRTMEMGSMQLTDLSPEVYSGLLMHVYAHMAEKGHISQTYTAYELILTPGVTQDEVNKLPGFLARQVVKEPHLVNFQIENKNSDPRIQATNELIKLIHSMRSLDISSRPEASAVKSQLNAIQTNLNHQLNERKILKDIIEKDAPKGKSGILQLRAIAVVIQHHNEKALNEWKAMPSDNKGPQPIPLKVPSLPVLKELMKEVENDLENASKAKLSSKEAKDAREKNDYDIYKEIKTKLGEEIASLTQKKQKIGNSDPATLAHINQVLESKNLQLKNAEIEIRTYERKHGSEISENQLSTFVHLMQDVQNKKTVPSNVNKTSVKKVAKPVSSSPNKPAIKKDNALLNVTPMVKEQVDTGNKTKNDPEIEKIKENLRDFKENLSKYKAHTDLAAKHQQDSLFGSSLAFLGKVDKSSKSVLADKLITRIDSLLNDSSTYKTPEELNKKFESICSDGIKGNAKIHQGKMSIATKSDLHDICEQAKQSIVAQHVKEKRR